MNTGKRFTKIDVLVTAICLVVLAVNLPVISSSGKTRAKTDVCMANLRQLTAAWQLYAEDNGGKLVNGAPYPGAMTNPSPDPRRIPDPAIYPGCTPATIAAAGLSPGSINRVAFAPLVCPADESPFCTGTPSTPLHKNEKPWTGPAWSNFGSFYSSCTPAPEDCQKCAVETGALYKYVRQNKIYICPNGRKGELVTYSIMDGMNGMWMYRASSANQATVRALCYKNMGQIKKASERAVFIDEGSVSSESYMCAYDSTVWADFPPVRHGNGTTVSYADGHAEWWKWKGTQTITYGKMHDAKPNPADGVARGYNPLLGTGGVNPPLGASCDAVNDLYKMQVSCWGSVGYTNPMPGCELSSD
jgi:prepilin-type processing-associated H-X9-DG protein